MADRSITAANVSIDQAYTGKLTKVNKEATEHIDAGEVVIPNASESKQCDLGDANGGTAADANAIGIAVATGDDNQNIEIVTEGRINVGTVASSAGTLYVLSETAGKLCPIADLTAGSYITPVAYADTDSTLIVYPTVTGNTV